MNANHNRKRRRGPPKSLPTTGGDPYIGPVTATAIIAAIGNGAALKRGERSQSGSKSSRANIHTGDQQKVLDISKGGNRYFKTLVPGLAPSSKRARSNLSF